MSWARCEERGESRGSTGDKDTQGRLLPATAPAPALLPGSRASLMGSRGRNHSPQKPLLRQWLRRSPDGFCQPRRPSGPAACLGHWISDDTQSELLPGSGGGKARGPGLRQEALVFNMPRHPRVVDTGTKNCSAAQRSYLTCAQHLAGTRALTSTTVFACPVTPWGLAPQQRWGA